MRVFVTGAAGYVGSAVLPDLLAAGHQVVGLARSDANADKLAAQGVEVHRGDLTDLDSLKAGAEQADGVIHLAFVHDWSGNVDAPAVDRAAIEAFGDALAGTDKPFVITSGTAGFALGRPATENDQQDPDTPLGARGLNERIALGLKDRGVRSASVRLAPSVHDQGDYGFVPIIIAAAREKGVSGYVGDGAQRWSAVHRKDAAPLFRLALEQAEPGTVLHGIGEEGVRIKDLAETIGRGLDLPVESVPEDKAMEHFGFLGGLLARDLPASSALTQERFGWTPTHQGLLADVAQYYLS